MTEADAAELAWWRHFHSRVVPHASVKVGTPLTGNKFRIQWLRQGVWVTLPQSMQPAPFAGGIRRDSVPSPNTFARFREMLEEPVRPVMIYGSASALKHIQHIPASSSLDQVSKSLAKDVGKMGNTLYEWTLKWFAHPCQPPSEPLRDGELWICPGCQREHTARWAAFLLIWVPESGIGSLLQADEMRPAMGLPNKDEVRRLKPSKTKKAPKVRLKTKGKKR